MPAMLCHAVPSQYVSRLDLPALLFSAMSRNAGLGTNSTCLHCRGLTSLASQCSPLTACIALAIHSSLGSDNSRLASLGSLRPASS